MNPPFLSRADRATCSRQIKKLYRIIDRKVSTEETVNYDLFYGDTGAALFFFYYGKAFKEKRSLVKAEKLIGRCLTLARQQPNLSFYAGLPGVLWAAHRILGKRKLSRLISDDELHEILMNMREQLKYIGLYELGHGAIGWALFSEIVPDSEWFRELVKKYLKKTRDKHTPFWSLGQRTLFSIPHGFSGPLLWRKNLRDSKDLTNYLSPMIDKPLPSYIPIINARRKPRSAWCYGDATIGYTLTVLAHRANHGPSRDLANKLFRRGIRSSSSYLPIRDFHLCHGKSGQALLAMRHYWLTNEADSARAAGYWLRKCLAHSDKKLNDCKSLGLIEGLSGMALVLLSELTGKKPEWDRALLLS